MGSVVVAVAALAIIGLLFAVDPGGVIAESGFPDYRAMDWQQLTAWGFRTIGVVAAQLLIVVLWLWPKYRPPQALEAHQHPRYSGTPQPGSMPAAAVSALDGHAIWYPAILASIIEMCQRGMSTSSDFVSATEQRLRQCRRFRRRMPQQRFGVQARRWPGRSCSR